MARSIGRITAHVNGSLTGRDDEPLRSFYRPMLPEVVERVERRLKAIGLTAAEASRMAGLSEDAIRNMQRAAKADSRKGVSTRTISELAPILQTTVGFLLDGTGPEQIGGSPMVRIIGSVGANPDGTTLYSMGQETGDQAPIPPGGSPKAFALEVKGHSMPGYADDGSLIYFEEQRTSPSHDMLGHVVVCELSTGEVLVKRLLRGSKAGRYDLESIAGPTIPDARLNWVAEITAVIPPKQARRIIVRSGHAAA